jgi:hypothetical protein
LISITAHEAGQALDREMGFASGGLAGELTHIKAWLVE